MRVRSTGPVIYLTGQTYLDMYLVGWLALGPSYFSQDVVLFGFFTGIVCSIIIWCAREK